MEMKKTLSINILVNKTLASVVSMDKIVDMGRRKVGKVDLMQSLRWASLGSD